MARLIDAETEEQYLEHLEIANTFWSRFKGLQLRKALRKGAGLWLTPCSSLHTHFMRFTIDVIMLDSQNQVLGVQRSVRPWRMVVCKPGTHSVIEVAPETPIKEGRKLLIRQ